MRTRPAQPAGMTADRGEMASDAKHVVIVGAGFGGLSAAQKLRGQPVRVTLVDRYPYHTFSPLLYQVANALIDPAAVEFPIEKVVGHHHALTVQQGEVTGIDLDGKVVHLDGQDDLAYDYVVIAAGSTTNFFGNSKIEGLSFPMKTVPEALRIRRHMIDAVIEAKSSPDDEEVSRLLSFVVVGGGPTGVEFAGALATMAKAVLPRQYRRVAEHHTSVTLVEGSDALLGPFDKKLQRDARKKRERLGVRVILGEHVVDADESSATLGSGAVLPCHTLFWSAGTTAVPPVADLDTAKEHGRIAVDEYLRVQGHEDKGAFAIGDAAAFTWQGSMLPAVSPPAMQQGRHVAKNIVAEATGGNAALEPFEYWDKGSMATISRTSAVAQTGRLRLKGPLGKLTWMFVHIWYLSGLLNRFRLMFSWFWDWLHYDRIFRRIIEAREAELAKG